MRAAAFASLLLAGDRVCARCQRVRRILPRPGVQAARRMEQDLRSSAVRPGSRGRTQPHERSVKNCDKPGWMSMREDVRATVISGGPVLYGEVHDNPLHHELALPARACRRIPQSCSSKSRADKTRRSTLPGGSEAQLQGGRARRSSKPLSIGRTAAGRPTTTIRCWWPCLKAQAPIYAGDVLARRSIKKVAKEGEGVIPADERAQPETRRAAGRKGDAASLEELFDGPLQHDAEGSAGRHGDAQRYRDAVLADTVLKASDKHGATDSDRGQRASCATTAACRGTSASARPTKKVLSVMLVEVEDGKTDPEAYVPRDPDGKPAADYIIFTPRAAARRSVRCNEEEGRLKSALLPRACPHQTFRHF